MRCNPGGVSGAPPSVPRAWADNDDVGLVLTAGVAGVLPRGPVLEQETNQRPRSPQRVGHVDVLPPDLQPVAEAGFRELLHPSEIQPNCISRSTSSSSPLREIRSSTSRARKYSSRLLADPVGDAMDLDEM